MGLRRLSPCRAQERGLCARTQSGIPSQTANCPRFTFLISQKIHTAPRIHLGLDAADKLTSAVGRLVAELAPLFRGCGNLVRDLLQEIVDANKHVEYRMPHAAKGSLLVQSIFIGLGIWKVEPAGIYGAGQFFQHLEALAFVMIGLNHSGVVLPEQLLGIAAGLILQVREACGAGRVRINGVCVARPPNVKSADIGAILGAVLILLVWAMIAPRKQT